jgi:hypothetical protein
MVDAYEHAFPPARAVRFREAMICAGAVLIVSTLRYVVGRDLDASVGRGPSTTGQYLLLRLHWLARKHLLLPATASLAAKVIDKIQQGGATHEPPAYPACGG